MNLSKWLIPFFILWISPDCLGLPQTFLLLRSDSSEYISRHVQLLTYYDSQDLKKVADLESFLDLSTTQLSLRENIFRQIALYQQARPISFNDAFEKIENAIRLSKQLDNTDILKGLVSLEFGTFLFVNESHEVAIEHLKLAFQILEEFGSEQMVFNINSRLCNAYKRMGDKDSMLAYHYKILEFTKTNKDKITHASAYNNFGIYLTEFGEFDQAIEQFKLGIEYLDAKNEDQHLFIANMKESMSHSYYQKGSHQEAIVLLIEAMEIRAHYYNLSIHLSFNYAVNYLFEMGEEKKAIALFNKYRYILESPKMELNHQDFYYDGRIKIYDALGNSEIANRLKAKSNEIKLKEKTKESRLLKQRTNLNKFINTKNKLVKAELANEVLQRKREAQQNTINLLISATIFLFGTLFFWFYRYRIKVERLSQQRQLELSNQKEEILALKNKNLEYDILVKENDLSLIAADNRLRTSMKKGFLKRLKIMEGLPPNEFKKELKLLKNEMEITIDSQEKISILQDNVDQINSAFESFLREKIKGISPTEIQLCSYLKLGMNNAQIANLLSKSEGTIRVYRSRLRKKSGITTSSEFDAFLKGL